MLGRCQRYCFDFCWCCSVAAAVAVAMAKATAAAATSSSSSSSRSSSGGGWQWQRQRQPRRQHNEQTQRHIFCAYGPPCHEKEDGQGQDQAPLTSRHSRSAWTAGTFVFFKTLTIPLNGLSRNGFLGGCMQKHVSQTSEQGSVQATSKTGFRSMTHA